jgi:hypothetical protein
MNSAKSRDRMKKSIMLLAFSGLLTGCGTLDFGLRSNDPEGQGTGFGDLNSTRHGSIVINNNIGGNFSEMRPQRRRVRETVTREYLE